MNAKQKNLGLSPFEYFSYSQLWEVLMECIIATHNCAAIFFKKSWKPREPDGKDISNFETGIMEWNGFIKKYHFGDQEESRVNY